MLRINQSDKNKKFFVVYFGFAYGGKFGAVGMDVCQ
jgi:hypothetical protein